MFIRLAVPLASRLALFGLRKSLSPTSETTIHSGFYSIYIYYRDFRDFTMVALYQTFFGVLREDNYHDTFVANASPQAKKIYACFGK